jgi:hypothetical protein
MYDGGMPVAVVARVLGWSLLTGGLGAGLGSALFKQDPDRIIAALCLACTGGVIGAVAGAAREIVAARRQKSGW